MKINPILALVVLVCAAASCAKEGIALTYLNQDAQIEKYVSDQLSKIEGSRASFENDTARLVVREGSGEVLRDGGTVAFYYAGYVFTGSLSTLFATNNEDVAQSAGWSGLSGEDRYSVQVADLSGGQLLEGLRRGLVGVRPGEECLILFNGKLGYGRKVQGTIPAGSALAYHIWVIDIENK